MYSWVKKTWENCDRRRQFVQALVYIIYEHICNNILRNNIVIRTWKNDLIDIIRS